ncbi:hypothetical protein SKAU_G00008600 [Synaphobranchus kaupii]|uniref:PiggyBac transposable element-derived protein domain-containing protein n=1 Tax=Synaphobranchus kaupii TaxID=118154 RepID=A0A9Q1JD37_SYNKA|nr:hypothetical protein SKAU_G00008600 [Synaphobranchus kaupii]
MKMLEPPHLPLRLSLQLCPLLLLPLLPLALAGLLSPLPRTSIGTSGVKRRATELQNEWHDISVEDVEPHQFPFCPQRTPGVQLDVLKEYSPLELFQLFFSKEAITVLCHNTNNNGQRKKLQGTQKQWIDVDSKDMLHYLSIVIYQGLIRPHSIRDLWRTDRLHNLPFPVSVMPGYRYEAINACLHMSDPAADILNDQLRGQAGYDGLFTVKPLQDQILTACRAFYHPHQNLAIDECMVAMKAQHRMKQYVKDKPTKWGFKLFILADSKTGYTCDFNIYQGKALTPSGNGLSYDACHEPDSGAVPWNRQLYQIHYGACGTIRENRIGFPRTEVNALPKSAVRGDMRWIRDGALLYVKWRDTRDVTMCSSIHKAYSGRTTQRCLKNPDGTWSRRAISVPEPVLQYNRYMGGVDLSDALIKYYSVSQKTSRWYRKLFLHFVDIAVVNSFIIHKELAKEKQHNPLTQKKFREALCTQLADVGKDGSTEREEDEEGGDSGSPVTGGGSREEATGLFPCSGHGRELL